jgi:hypothetical protein
MMGAMLAKRVQRDGKHAHDERGHGTQPVEKVGWAPPTKNHEEYVKRFLLRDAHPTMAFLPVQKTPSCG